MSLSPHLVINRVFLGIIRVGKRLLLTILTITLLLILLTISLPHVYLKSNYNDEPLCFLIDTGSTISIVKYSSLHNKPVLDPEIIKLKGLSDNDSYCEYLGSIRLKFDYRVSSKSKILFDYVFHAINDTINLNYDGIIGSDFIQYFKIDIQYSKNILNLEGYEIPICFSICYTSTIRDSH